MTPPTADPFAPRTDEGGNFVDQEISNEIFRRMRDKPGPFGSVSYSWTETMTPKQIAHRRLARIKRAIGSAMLAVMGFVVWASIAYFVGPLGALIVIGADALVALWFAVAVRLANTDDLL